MLPVNSMLQHSIISVTFLRQSQYCHGDIQYHIFLSDVHASSLLLLWKIFCLRKAMFRNHPKTSAWPRLEYKTTKCFPFFSLH